MCGVCTGGDLVTWIDEGTPLELIAHIRPDIRVKGGDCDTQKLAGTRMVEAYGGRALALPFVHGCSTTALARKIRAVQAN
jgi:bifunctional ADP-heptose synthase (sugar kinase/adenylyltransferase)